MFGMKNHFDISDSIEISEVDIAGVACITDCISLLASNVSVCCKSLYEFVRSSHFEPH